MADRARGEPRKRLTPAQARAAIKARRATITEEVHINDFIVINAVRPSGRPFSIKTRRTSHDPEVR